MGAGSPHEWQRGEEVEPESPREQKGMDMRQQQRLTGAFALTATAAMLAMALALAFRAGVSFAKTESTAATYYEDSQNNLCVGLPTGMLFAGSCEWKCAFCRPQALARAASADGTQAFPPPRPAGPRTCHASPRLKLPTRQPALGWWR